MTEHILVKAFKAKSAVEPFRLVSVDASGKVLVASDPSKPLIGISSALHTAAGDSAEIHLMGIAEVKAGASFDCGVLLNCDSDGNAIAKSKDSDRAIGVALESATSSGDLVRVLIVPH